jgi:hypothetical protein
VFYSSTLNRDFLACFAASLPVISIGGLHHSSVSKYGVNHDSAATLVES